MKPRSSQKVKTIGKCATGIAGLDQITEGGLPKGRTTLVCGGPGCGKTVFGMEFLVRGAMEFDEPGVFMAFEETARELTENFGSMNFDLADLCSRKKLYLEHVRVERNEIEETGEYDLEGLFIRLRAAIESVGARRVVLDTIECLFAGFKDLNILRAELRRLFRWLKECGVTAIVTAETGTGQLTRYGLEEYVADCVIMLDHRVVNQNSVRRLRVVKYRGSASGHNEYPFLIGSDGFSVLPLSSLGLEHKASTQRISTGIPGLDAMLGGKGFFRGTSVLVSGGAGSGKSSIAAHFANAACQRGERALMFVSEQSPDEVIRGMRSIGIDLEKWVKRGLLQFHATRAGFCGLEKHLLMMHNATVNFAPKIVIIDPITNYGSLGQEQEIKAMLTRLIDLFKSSHITAMFTSLVSAGNDVEDSVVGVSSLMDAWILLRAFEIDGERNRGLYVLKSRGMAHSNQVREFILTDNGARLVDVYVGPQGVLTGSARVAQQMKERIAAVNREGEKSRRRLELENKRHQLELQITDLRSKFEVEQRALSEESDRTSIKDQQSLDDRVEMARFREVRTRTSHGNGRG